MTPETELKKVKNEVHRKIGQNLLLIQGIEDALKKLIALNGLKIKASGSDTNKRLAAVHKKTLGNLAGEFLESYYVDQGETSKKEEEVQEAQFSFSFKINSAELFAQTKKTLSSIVDERNMLVHHFLNELNEGIKSWEDADHQLEKQYDKLVYLFEHLKSLLDSIRQSFKKIVSSEEFLNGTASDKKLGNLNS